MLNAWRVLQLLMPLAKPEQRCLGLPWPPQLGKRSVENRPDKCCGLNERLYQAITTGSSSPSWKKGESLKTVLSGPVLKKKIVSWEELSLQELSAKEAIYERVSATSQSQ